MVFCRSREPSAAVSQLIEIVNFALEPCDRSTNMPRCILTAALVVLCGMMGTESLVCAQPGPPGNSTPPTAQATPDAFPRVRLTYYINFENGGSKEIRFANLTEWTTNKDVYIELVPNEEATKGYFPAPDTDARLSPDFEFTRPPSHIWKIRYEPAATEGQSRLFVRGIGGRTGRTRIYGVEDTIILIYIIGTGWHELGAEGRVARYLQTHQPTSNSPLPTRSQ